MHHPRLALCLVLALTAGHVPAQIGLDSAAEFYEDALKRYDDESYIEALVQLRNALQKDPNHLPSLVLMGRTYIEQKEGAAAEDALRTALDKGADPALVKVPLARAYLMQNKAARMVSEVTPSGLSAEDQARLHAIRAKGFMSLRRFRDAEHELELARATAPNVPEPLIEQVTLALARGDVDAAKPVAARLIEMAPDNPEAWNAYASVAHGEGALDEALERYGRAVELDPWHYNARIARVSICLSTDRDELAAKDLEFLSKEFPNAPRATYLRAVRLARQDDAAGTRRELENTVDTLSLLPEEYVQSDDDLLLVAGMAHFGLGAMEKARIYLEQYVVLQPRASGPRKILGQALLRLDLTDKAAEVLKKAAELAPRDPRTLSLLAQAYGRQGRHRQAARLLEQAREIASEDPEIKAQLAIARIQSGDTEVGIQSLSEVFETTPETGNVGTMLAMTYLEEGDTDAARRTVERLLERDPRDPFVLNLKGVTELEAGDRDAARVAFEMALDVDPEFSPAAINLAKVDATGGRLKAARERLLKLDAAYPEDPKIMLELARVEEMGNNLRGAERWAMDARRADESFMDAYLYLMDLHAREGQLDKALDLAFEADRVSAGALPILAALSELLIRSGDTDRARLFLKRLVDEAEFDTRWLTRAGRMQTSIGEFGDARYTLYKAIQGDPKHIPAHVAYIELHLRTSQFDKATDLIGEFRAQFPDSAEGPRLAGDMAMLTGDTAAARSAFDEAFARAPDARLVLRRFETFAAEGRFDDGIGLLDDWLSGHPDDRQVARTLADAHMATGDLAAADAAYRGLLATTPKDPMLLNNHALTLYGLGQREDAIATAETAFDEAPENPDVADTLGWMLVRTGQPERGLSLLREASARRADNPEIQYHLAEALHRLGRDAEARRILDDVLADNRPFEGVDAARALRDGLAN